MISVKLDSLDKVAQVVKACGKYTGHIDTQCVCGKYSVAADSLLGMEYLVGHTATLEPNVKDERFKNEYLNDLKKIDGVTITKEKDK